MDWYSVILLKVSPETHRVKVESLSRTNESKLTSLKLKMLRPLCHKTVSLKTDS